MDELGQTFRFRTLGAQILGKFGMICWLKLKNSEKFFKIASCACNHVRMLPYPGRSGKSRLCSTKSVILDSPVGHCHWMAKPPKLHVSQF